MTSYKSKYGITLKRAKQLSKAKIGRYPSPGSYIPVYRRRITIKGLYGENIPGYETVNRELAGYSPQLAQKPQLLVLNKMDLPDTDKKAKLFQSALNDREVLLISAVTRQGIEALTSKIIELLDRFHDIEQQIGT